MSGSEAFAKEIAAIVAQELKGGVAQKELYTVEDAMTFLACSRDQIRRFTETGKLPMVKIDSRPRYRLKDLLRLIDLCKE
jgi:hypothetical protein